MIIQPILRGDDLEYILRNRTRVLAISRKPVSKQPSVRNQEGRGENSLPRTSPPPTPGKQRDRRAHHRRIIHILRRDWSDRREQEHHTNEEDPGNSDAIQRLAHPSQHVRTGAEIDLGAVDVACQDDSYVGEVQGWGGDVEDCDDGLGAADADAV